MTSYQKTLIEIRKIRIAPAVEGIEELDLMSQRSEGRKKIRVLVAVTAERIAISISAEDAEDLQPGVPVAKRFTART